jgi:hypothetical protein
MASELRVRLPVITNSQQRCFRRCAREHYLTYELGYRPAEKEEALRFGDLVHVGLEAWWSAAADRLDAAIEAMRGRAVDDFELVRAGVMLQGYDARWGAAADDYEVLGVEVEFRAPLINPETGAPSRTFELGGKLDVVVRDKCDGRVKLIEHKTTSSDIGDGSTYWKRLVLDPQISTYFAGGKAVGYPISECLYDVLGKPALRPLKATPEESRKYTKDGRLYANQRDKDETPDEFRQRLVEHIAEQPNRYYQRGPVQRLEQEELDAAYDAWATARQIREAQLANRWPRNPDSCERYGRMCAFFDVCSGTASLDDETRFRRVENVHEELSSEAA